MIWHLEHDPDTRAGLVWVLAPFDRSQNYADLSTGAVEAAA